MGAQTMNDSLRILPPSIAILLRIRGNLACIAAERALDNMDKKYLAEVFAMRVDGYLKAVSEGAQFEIDSRGTNGR
jgi:hypothetical protein